MQLDRPKIRAIATHGDILVLRPKNRAAIKLLGLGNFMDMVWMDSLGRKMKVLDKPKKKICTFIT